ncbi:serine hydrolase [Planosporangium thailandense]|uniref:Serine hydrolase n=1 Tax=Planosporangium thailandense TaxID=765197 RepID=A0ABX0XXT1_9ACTN|nr:serine hydrolase [Planosporangium thailandense]NJC70055.1 serine hydrolase [Planosporangium thailandense]
MTAGVSAAVVVVDPFTLQRAPGREAAPRPSPLNALVVPVQTPSASPTAALSAVRSPQEQRQQNEAALTAALQKYDEDTYADLAVTVVDRRTGRTFSFNGQRPFETASTVKVDILATLLLQAQRAGRTLTSSEKSLARSMIEESDNDAATALWKKTGGISGSAGVFGLIATTPGARGKWGVTTTTTEDRARLIDTLADPAGPVANADYLFGLMRNVADDQSWGISAAARPSETVAVKNGWMTRDDDDGRWEINSIGRITGADTDVTMAILSRGHASQQAGITMVEAVAKLARTYLEW